MKTKLKSIAVSAILLVGLTKGYMVNGQGKDSRHMVVLELFTSQGCSSCPPADAILAQYAKAGTPGIIPLSFHVDYWNRLGWTDPFSNAAFSERQQWYSRHLPKGSVYTPQLIINGKKEAVGNNQPLITQLLQNELTVQPGSSIEITGINIVKNNLDFSYQANAIQETELVNIAIVQKQATTAIRAGENKGASITNRNIVRSFLTHTAMASGKETIALPASFKTGEYALVVYLQNKKDLSITSAVMKDL